MFDALLNHLLTENAGASLALKGSLQLFSPELCLAAGIVLMLLARLCGVDRKLPTAWIALWLTLAGFILTLLQFYDFTSNLPLGTPDVLEYFSGMLAFDRFAAFVRLFLMLFLVFVIALTVVSGIPDEEDAPDFYTLLLGSAIGMLLMVGANNLLIVFLGIEMVSVPSYAMVGFLKGRKQASEGALKFVVYGAGAAGVMLYGISLLAGLLGTAEFPEMALRLQQVFAEGRVTIADPALRTLTLAILMILVGFAFKLSIFPFHFWCPDAFQGAAAEVGGYLSVASKAAAFALLVRLVSAVMAPLGPALQPVFLAVGVGMGVIAAASATYGNLAAYFQTNMKRLLAYSTIAHAGYMLMAVAALVVLQNGSDTFSPAGESLAERSTRAVEGLLYYLAAYLFMNLGAFAVTALIRNEIFSEEIDDYRGLGHQAPVLAFGMALCLFSLVGLPPLGGFVGKLFVFAAVYDAGYAHWSMWVLLAFGCLNSVFSLFYYARVLRTMYLLERPAGARAVRVPAFSVNGLYVLVVTLPLLLLGISHINVVSNAARTAAIVFFP